MKDYSIKIIKKIICEYNEENNIENQYIKKLYSNINSSLKDYEKKFDIFYSQFNKDKNILSITKLNQCSYHIESLFHDCLGLLQKISIITNYDNNKINDSLVISVIKFIQDIFNKCITFIKSLWIIIKNQDKNILSKFEIMLKRTRNQVSDKVINYWSKKIDDMNINIKSFDLNINKITQTMLDLVKKNFNRHLKDINNYFNKAEKDTFHSFKGLNITKYHNLSSKISTLKLKEKRSNGHNGIIISFSTDDTEEFITLKNGIQISIPSLFVEIGINNNKILFLDLCTIGGIFNIPDIESYFYPQICTKII